MKQRPEPTLTPQRLLTRKRKERRKTIRRADRRRRAALLQVLAAAPDPDIATTWDGDACLALLEGQGNRVAAIVPSLTRRSIALLTPLRDLNRDGASVAACSCTAPPPSRVVLKSRTSKIRPWLAISEPPVARISVQEALTIAREVSERHGADQVLEPFQRTTRLPWRTADEVLFQSGITDQRASEELLGQLDQAHTFWGVWRDARELYEAAVKAGQVNPVAGDWGLITDGNIERLLPGGVLPRGEARRDYLVRLILDERSVELHFFSLALRPCFRVLLE